MTNNEVRLVNVTKSYFLIAAAAAILLVMLLIVAQVLSPISSVETQKSNQPASIELSFGHNIPEDSAMHLAALRFAEQVSQKTEGRIRIKIYPAQTLANDHQMVEMARNGELDMLLTPTAKLSVPVPAMQYADLPFLFPTREDAYAMLDGEPGRLLLDKLHDIGLVGVAFWENGFKHFTGNQLYRSPADFAGKKFRVMKSRLLVEQFESMGAKALPIDFHMTRSALRDGVVDGQENPLIAIVSMGFHLEQSHLIYSEHAYLGYVFSFSQKTLESLSQQDVQILMETAKEVTPWQREETQRREAQLLAQIAQAGVEIYRLSAQEKAEFAQQTAHLVRQFEPIIGSNIISKTQFYLNKKYALKAANTPKMAIGLNADLSTGGAKAGLAIKRGVELALEDINARGGVLGHELILMPMDHRAVSSIGVENMKVFTHQPEVLAVVGGIHSAVILDEMSHIQRAKMPYLIPWASASEVTENDYQDNYVFRLSVNDRLVFKMMVQQSLKKAKRPAVIVENSVWGRSNLNRIVAELKQQGVDAAAQIVFNRGQKSFDYVLEQIEQAQADGLILIANSVEGAMLVESMAEQETWWPIVSHWGLAGGEFFNRVRPFIDKLDLYMLQTVSLDRLQHASADLKARFFRQFEREPIFVANGMVQAYDLVNILAAAIEQAGAFDRALIKQALETLPYHAGVLKDYSPPFSAQRHDALNVQDFYFAKLSEQGLQPIGQ